MATGFLRHLVPSRPHTPTRSVEDLQALIARLAGERQQLREGRADHEALERNRVDLVEAQRELSYAFIAQHALHAA